MAGRLPLDRDARATRISGLWMRTRAMGTQLTSFAGVPVGSPRWSPDGSKIASYSRKFGNADTLLPEAEVPRLGVNRRVVGSSPAEEPNLEDGLWLVGLGAQGVYS